LDIALGNTMPGSLAVRAAGPRIDEEDDIVVKLAKDKRRLLAQPLGEGTANEPIVLDTEDEELGTDNEEVEVISSVTSLSSKRRRSRSAEKAGKVDGDESVENGEDEHHHIWHRDDAASTRKRRKMGHADRAIEIASSESAEDREGEDEVLIIQQDAEEGTAGDEEPIAQQADGESADDDEEVVAQQAAEISETRAYVRPFSL
jgi:hypothetical protein